MGQFRKTFGSEDSGNLGTNLARAFLPVSQRGNPGGSGKFVQNVTLGTSSPVTVQHNLGRTPRGWLVVDQTEHAQIRRTAWSRTSLTLEADADTTASVWVF